MKSFLKLLVIIQFVLIVGIVGGIENGEPLTNILYEIPTIAFTWFLMSQLARIDTDPIRDEDE